MSIKNVKKLKLMVRTNVDKTPYELTLSKIHHNEDNTLIGWIKLSQYPFFTEDVEYPQDILSSKTYNELLHIFFDKQEFIRVIINRQVPRSKIISGGGPDRIADKNIMTMLQFLFPTSYPSKNNINTSLNKYFKKQSPDIQFSLGDVTSMVYGGKYSYIKASSGICTVTEVIWLNDVLNNILYRELIDKLISYGEWAKMQHTITTKEIEDATKKLVDGLSVSPIASTDTASDQLLITQQEIDVLQKEKRFYNPDDIKTDMIDIIKEYVDIDATNAGMFESELDKLVEYFVDTFILNKERLSQFVRFKEKFTFKYKENGIDVDLFRLHKKYDGEDKKEKINTLNAERQTKIEKQDKLQNGYGDKTTWYFGKTQIEQYIKNLDELIDIAIAKQSVRGRKEAPTPDEINDTLLKDITISPTYTNISVIPALKYTKSTFKQFDRTQTQDNKAFIDNVTSRIDAITIDAMNEINTQLKTIQSEIEKLDKDLIELNKSDINAFSFKGETDFTEKSSISDIKDDLKDKINTMQNDIFDLVIKRYNRFQDIIQSEDLRGKYAVIDGAIDNIASAIKKLNNLSNPTPDDILNITEVISALFDTLKASNQIAISRTIEEKLAKIGKLSSQIKILNKIQGEFFPKNPTGIFVNYYKELDNDKGVSKTNTFNKSLLEELNQSKYSTFVNTVSFIKETFLKKEFVSLNKDFSEMLEKYFENKSNSFYEIIVEPANKLINEGEYPTTVNDLWNVSVTLYKGNNKENEYEISLYINLIEGELNAANQSEIKCQFLDEELTKRFNELIDEKNTPFEPTEGKSVFSIKKAQDKKKEDDKKKQEEIDSALHSLAPKNIIPVNPITTGGENRKTKSNARRKSKSVFKRTQKRYKK